MCTSDITFLKNNVCRQICHVAKEGKNRCEIYLEYSQISSSSNIITSCIDKDMQIEIAALWWTLYTVLNIPSTWKKEWKQFVILQQLRKCPL